MDVEGTSGDGKRPDPGNGGGQPVILEHRVGGADNAPGPRESPSEEANAPVENADDSRDHTGGTDVHGHAGGTWPSNDSTDPQHPPDAPFTTGRVPHAAQYSRQPSTASSLHGSCLGRNGRGPSTAPPDVDPFLRGRRSPSPELPLEDQEVGYANSPQELADNRRAVASWRALPEPRPIFDFAAWRRSGGTWQPSVASAATTPITAPAVMTTSPGAPM
jgi:hypothetical protein